MEVLPKLQVCHQEHFWETNKQLTNSRPFLKSQVNLNHYLFTSKNFLKRDSLQNFKQSNYAAQY